MVGIVNPETLLVGEDDLAMLEWAQEQLPTDALVAVNAWPWLGEENWAGSDGGYWLLPLTGLQTTTPPLGYGDDPAYAAQVNGFNRQLAAAEGEGAEKILALLQTRGVTHVLMGERGGSIRPEVLMGDSHFRLMKTNGAAWLFQVVY